jgi:tetratricopeptide (TPR) repeat protein
MNQNKHSRTLIAVLQFVLFVIFLPVAETRAQQTGGARLLTQPEVKALPAKAKRWALIIGVNNYEKDISPLQGSVNDAKALKYVLVRYAGFPENQIVLMTTDTTDADLLPTRGNILDALDRLSRQIPEGGLLLFSFSGHGVSIGNDAFLIPADGRVYQNLELMRDRSIDVLRVRRAIQLTGVKQVLMFLDACRNEPLRGKGDIANPLTEAYTKAFSFDKNKEVEAFATIFATSLGDRAYEFYDKQSQQYRGFFSYAIEEALKGEAANQNGEITLGRLINYLERAVSQRVSVEKNQKQVPYSMTEGYRNSELILALAPPTAATAPVDPISAPNRFSSSIAWSFQPLIVGGWEILNEQASHVIYERLLKATPPESINLAKRIRQFRRTSLSFYPDSYLYEGLLPTDHFSEGGLFTFIVSKNGQITFLNGTSAPIHKLNQEFSLKIVSNETAEDYLRFFHSAVHGEEGDFHIVDNGSDILWEKDVTISNRQIVEKHIKPLLLERINDGTWHFDITIQYGDSVFYGKMKLESTGMVEMVADQPFSADLPARRYSFTGPLRHEVLNWGFSSIVSENWEPTNENTSRQVYDLLERAYGSTALMGTVRRISNFRRLSLPFYAGAYLYEGLIPPSNSEGRQILTFVVLRDNTLTLLNGTASPIQELNRKVPLSITTKDQVEAYFRFFAFAGYGGGASVRVIDEKNKLSWVDAEKKTQIEAVVRPVEVTKKNESSWAVSATVQRARALYQAKYKLHNGGMVEMTEEKVIESNINIRSEKFLDAVRYETERSSNVKSSITIVDAHFHNGIGSEYENEDKLDVAISYYTKAIQLNPKYSEAYSNLGDAYRKKGDFENALKDLNQGIELNPRNAKAHANRGLSYFDKLDYQAAIRDFTKAIEIDPQFVNAYNNRGSAYYNVKDYQAAIRDCTKAIELDPKDAFPYNIRALAYEQIGRPDLAKADKQMYEKLK